MAGNSMLDAFLSEILSSVRVRDGHRITDLIQLDFESIQPHRRKPYADLNAELNARYPPVNDAALSKHCKDALPQTELGSFHSSFSDSIVQYFRYLRDFTTADNQSRAREIRQLTSQCIAALGDSKYGVIMIPIVLSFSRVLARIASNLDREPQQLVQASTATTDLDEPGGTKVSFVESTANVLRDAFIKCLAGSPGTARGTKPAPDDKRYGIYLTANSCLKLLWQCRKLRNAQQMFMSIDAQSPPLSFYPAAQRVTYLYYLGRYHFANNHYHRAQLTLEAAYKQCHREAIKHRRSILVYLVASNICLGRFPSSQLFLEPGAHDLAQRFSPLCRLIKCGDFLGLEKFLDLLSGSVHAQWFLQKRILLQLRDRCEVLVWWSFIRKVFICAGYKGEDKKIPYLKLDYVRYAAHWVLQNRSSVQDKPFFGMGQSASTLPQSLQPYIDNDFVDLEQAIKETGFDTSSGEYNDHAMDQNAIVQASDESNSNLPAMYEIESVFLSLIQQGFLRGFVLHNPNNPRFAIPGAQAAGGPVPKGFPPIWAIVQSHVADTDGEAVPGWVKDDILTAGSLRAGRSQLGGVVRLSGARPVGIGS